LAVRLVSTAEVPESGVFVKWSALAETFGDGTTTPEEAEATLSERERDSD
jgi:hypothetical protein